MRVAIQVLWAGPRAVGSCCPSMMADPSGFALKAITVCTQNYGPLLRGHVLCADPEGRDLGGANSTELHYIGGISCTRSQHL